VDQAALSPVPQFGEAAALVANACLYPHLSHCRSYRALMAGVTEAPFSLLGKPSRLGTNHLTIGRHLAFTQTLPDANS
jgi:hypothetical protein